MSSASGAGDMRTVDDDPAEPTPEELARHPHTAALRARRRSVGWWKGAGLAAGLVSLCAIVLLGLLLLVPLTVADTVEDGVEQVAPASP